MGRGGEGEREGKGEIGRELGVRRITSDIHQTVLTQMNPTGDPPLPP